MIFKNISKFAAFDYLGHYSVTVFTRLSTVVDVVADCLYGEKTPQ